MPLRREHKSPADQGEVKRGHGRNNRAKEEAAQKPRERLQESDEEESYHAEDDGRSGPTDQGTCRSCYSGMT